jgi:hypothetical protein
MPSRTSYGERQKNVKTERTREFLGPLYINRGSGRMNRKALNASQVGHLSQVIVSRHE